jgi:hypothetical protein
MSIVSVSSRMAALRFAVLSSLVASWLGACASPIVGGECIEGFSVCRGACVDLQSDALNCGACGNACGVGATCAAGVCVAGDAGLDGGRIDLGPRDADVRDADLRDGEVGDALIPEGGPGDAAIDDAAVVDGDVTDAAFDASMVDGGVDDAGAFDAGDVDADVLDGAVSDGGGRDAGDVDAAAGDAGAPIPCELGQTRCGEVCVRLNSDPANCGMCGFVCDPMDVCFIGACAPMCEAPLVACGRSCVDLQTDADHCGMCGNVCATGICIDGMCSAGASGHVVLIGHDFTTTRVGMNRIAGNAVFLGAGAPVRVLVYEGRARAAAIAGTDVAIEQVSAASGRGWTRIPVTRGNVPSMLASADAFVVYAQRDATDAELTAIGAEWGAALDTFVRRGGAVVVFETNSTTNVGTFQILGAAGLLSVVSRTVITGTIVQVDSAAAGDAVAIGVPPMYRAETTSVRFDSTESLTIVRDAVGPVVIHRVVGP